MVNEYVVYAHFDKDNICFYVGFSGNKNRPYTKSGRNKIWIDFAKNGFSVEILKTFTDKNEALIFEKQEIKKRNPISNIWKSSVIKNDIKYKTIIPNSNLRTKTKHIYLPAEVVKF
jgi:hypothetical protein